MLYGARTLRRADAQRNRAAIVRAASEVLSSDWPVALMPEIARRAGIGQATLYRHFPDRNALAIAVIGDQLQELEAACAAGTEDPAAFGALLREVLRNLVVMRPLVLLAARLEPAQRLRYQQRLIAAFAGPLQCAQEHGQVRADLVPADVLLLFTMVRASAEAADEVLLARAGVDRSIDLLLEGLDGPERRRPDSGTGFSRP